MISKTYLTRDDLNKFPTKIFENSVCSNEQSTVCDICLESYQSGDQIKSIPCLHSFHSSCIDIWLLKSPSCPNCRLNVIRFLKTEVDEKPNSTISLKVTRPKTTIDNTIKMQEHHRFMNEFYMQKRYLRQYSNDNLNRNRSSTVLPVYRNPSIQNAENQTSHLRGSSETRLNDKRTNYNSNHVFDFPHHITRTRNRITNESLARENAVFAARARISRKGPIV